MSFITNLSTPERVGYSAERAMAARMICSVYAFTIKPIPRILARCDELETAMPSFDENVLSEISEYLYSYGDRIYTFESGGYLWGVVPTTFASSSLAIVLKFNLSVGAALRLIEASRYKKYFTLSPFIRTRKSRMSRAISEMAEQFEDFFDRVIQAFWCEQMHEEKDFCEVVDLLRERCMAMSLLVGCPVTFFERRTYTETPSINTNGIDLNIFNAFLITMMMLARQNSTDRSIRISFEALSQSVAVVMELGVGEEDLSQAISFWESASAERLMPFGFSMSDDTLKVGLQPYRREFSYLGLKQKIEWDF